MQLLRTSKRILLTGASRGIGRAAAIMLAQQGHRVFLAARDRDALEQVAREIAANGGEASVLPMDVTDDASVQRAVAQLAVEGGCDIVVNNAGACDQAEFLLQRAEARRAELELNYFGPQRLVRALLPAFMRRGSGMIVNVSSLLASLPAATTANYSASKAALEAWSKALRGEVERFGLRVVVFVAPHTDTDAGRAAKFDGVISLPVDYTARQLVKALDRGSHVYAGSPVYRVFMLLARWFPGLMHARMHASTRRLLSPNPLDVIAR